MLTTHHATIAARSVPGRALVAAAGLLLGLAACGSSTSVSPAPAPGGSVTGTGTVSATASAPPPAASLAPASPAPASPTPTPPPLAGLALVWTVHTATDQVVRTARPGTAGSGTAVAHLPQDDFVLTAGHGRVVSATADRHLRITDVPSGAQRLVGAFTGSVLGAAISPDGGRIVFLDAGAPSVIRSVDLGSGTTTALRTINGSPADAPTTWGPDRIGAVQIVPNSDAGPQGVAALAPATGARTSSSTTPDADGVLVSPDATAAVLTSHAALGDDADAQQGPGPAGPFNTLSRLDIGGAATVIRQKAHHSFSVLGMLPGASKILIFDASAAGGYAGITMSPDFGVLSVTSSGAATNYRHLDGEDYQAGVFYQDGTTVALGQHDSHGSALVEAHPGGAVTTLDSLPGAQDASRVYLIGG